MRLRPFRISTIPTPIFSLGNLTTSSWIVENSNSSFSVANFYAFQILLFPLLENWFHVKSEWQNVYKFQWILSGFKECSWKHCHFLETFVHLISNTRNGFLLTLDNVFFLFTKLTWDLPGIFFYEWTWPKILLMFLVFSEITVTFWLENTDRHNKLHSSAAKSNDNLVSWLCKEGSTFV